MEQPTKTKPQKDFIVSDIPLSLYVHIPWCERKCPYCDFNSHTAKSPVDAAQYVTTLLNDLERDLRLYRKQLRGRRLSSIFIGGGTPSLFPAEHIQNLLFGIEQRIDFESEIEITLEANPSSAEAERFIGFRQAGVNRLSIGIQSFNKQHLRTLGRVHNDSEALVAASYAKQAGFPTYNLDLMFGLPEQSIDQALNDVQLAIQLQPTHLSCYQLTIEPNTLFHHQPPVTPDDETLWEMQTAIQTQLCNAGYLQYEVSAYAQDGWHCRHNANYWQYGDYLGIGAGAHGKISDLATGIQRYWKVKHPTSYIQRCVDDKDPAGARTQVSVTDTPFEFMLNALRLTDGFSLSLYQSRTFLPVDRISKQLEKHQAQNLITIDNNIVQPTTRGKSLIDSMLQDYLVDG